MTGKPRPCDTCGTSLPAYKGIGRPRVRCTRCAADTSAIVKRWRAAHPVSVRLYNLNRRKHQVIQSLVEG